MALLLVMHLEGDHFEKKAETVKGQGSSKLHFVDNLDVSFFHFEGEGGGTLYNLKTLHNTNGIEALIVSALVIIGNDASREWKD
jgi:hypothetical protein